jgi:hypothetical protein
MACAVADLLLELANLSKLRLGSDAQVLFASVCGM